MFENGLSNILVTSPEISDLDFGHPDCSENLARPVGREKILRFHILPFRKTSMFQEIFPRAFLSSPKILNSQGISFEFMTTPFEFMTPP